MAPPRQQQHCSRSRPRASWGRGCSRRLSDVSSTVPSVLTQVVGGGGPAVAVHVARHTSFLVERWAIESTQMVGSRSMYCLVNEDEQRQEEEDRKQRTGGLGLSVPSSMGTWMPPIGASAGSAGGTITATVRLAQRTLRFSEMRVM
ncbi:hypothetical protein CEXT_599511 [Caerostris extrusa]|uniref:Uncharacterized protein n=1 Tax=Caerostris extrusa TaxID=172846 RepID=A0AAV4TES9_CAEEX|nr:hypothetical protein CEXT_599511 [Caerostris extrusa]